MLELPNEVVAAALATLDSRALISLGVIGALVVWWFSKGSLAAFFHRQKNADDVSDQSVRQIGMSFATTWAAGPSVYLGVFFLWRYGVVPGTVWIACNILTLTLAAAFWTYVPLARRWVTVSVLTIPLFLMYVVMEGLMTLINLGAIRQMLDGTGLANRVSVLTLMTGQTATYVAVAIGIAIVMLISRFGFRGSVLSDRWQYAVQITGAALFALLTLWFTDWSVGAKRPDLFVAGEPGKLGGEDWIFLGLAGMITAAFSYAQIWERLAAVRPPDAIRVGLWGSFYFGIYMAFIWIAGYFLTKNVLLSWIVFAIVMAITTSTIDSSVSAMQFIARKVGVAAWWGSLTALVVVLSFLFIPQAGIEDIWNFTASVRWQLVVVAVGVTILAQGALWAWNRKSSTVGKNG